MRKSFGKGGVHPPEMKLTLGAPIKDIDLPRRVAIQLNQSLGKPAKEIVAVGSHVERGEKIAEKQGMISANLHSPITGTVKKIDNLPASDGHYYRTIEIEASDEDHIADLQQLSDARPQRSVESALALPPEEIIAAVDEAGIVGLGGATFPTSVKLMPSKAGQAEMLLINGSECEPYLTCDEAIMREMADEVVDGIAILLRACGAKKAIVGIENNKPEAIKAMTVSSRRYPAIEVVGLKTRYPEGGEKMLTEALTGRRIAPGQLPITQGVIIQNVATALAVYHAVVWGIPLIERVMTVSGSDFEKRGNYRVCNGTPLKSLIEQLGGLPSTTVRIVNGGTMMGRAMADIEGQTTKGMSGLLLLSEDETDLSEPLPCVRCGRCVDVCPMGLEPLLIARLSELGRYEDARANHIMDCMECGCCSYTCISRRRLVDWIKVGKNGVRCL